MLIAEQSRQALFSRLLGADSAVWKTTVEAESFAKVVASYYDDPLGFALWAFPWGLPGRLENSNIEIWQAKILDEVGRQIKEGRHTIRIAVASGHGVGKTALMAILIIWFLSTRGFPRIVVTANTEQQLHNTTWRELAVWRQMCLVGFMFQWTATKLINKEHPSTWYASATAWSISNPQAFAGTHEKNVLILFDESSKIEKVIWETAFGALTTTGSMMFAFGNATHNSGMFYDCFGSKRWTTMRVDSRSVKYAASNQQYINELIEDHGIDSDFVRVRVRGLHPLSSSIQFISLDTVKRAQKRTIDESELSPLSPIIMGIDVARHGDDSSVICWRKYNKLLKFERLRIPNTMDLASHIAMRINETQPDVAFIDAGGFGIGVYDRLIQLGHERVVIPVHFGEKAYQDKIYANRRAEIWSKMKAWLENADIPDDARLKEELISVEYGYQSKTDRLVLESKDSMRKRGLDSPDISDSIACTFSENVPPRKDMGWNSVTTEPDYA